MIERMIRAARLDMDLYDEVEHDSQLTTQALQVVVLVSLLGGIGSGLGKIFLGQGEAAFWGLILGIVAGIVGWAVWSFLTYWVGTNLFQGTSTYGELLRTIAFANSPGSLNFFSFIPLLGGLVVLVVAIWILIAGVVAVRQALDFSTGKAIATVIVGWVAMMVISVVVGAILGVLGFIF